MSKNVERMTQITMLIAISILFHMIEASIPIPVPIPGFKLGLANIVGMIALYMFDYKVMIQVNLIRVILASLLRGLLFSTAFMLSFSGIIVSIIAVLIFKRFTKMSIYGISVAGSVFHSVGQVIAISFIYQQMLMQTLLPILILLGVLTGICVAYIAKQVLIRIDKKIRV